MKGVWRLLIDLLFNWLTQAVWKFRSCCAVYAKWSHVTTIHRGWQSLEAMPWSWWLCFSCKWSFVITHRWQEANVFRLHSCMLSNTILGKPTQQIVWVKTSQKEKICWWNALQAPSMLLSRLLGSVIHHTASADNRDVMSPSVRLHHGLMVVHWHLKDPYLTNLRREFSG